MEDYTDKLCKIDGKVLAKCIRQDDDRYLVYFELPEHLKHLDCGECNVPSFKINAGLVEIVDVESEYVLNYILDNYYKDENDLDKF